MHLGNNNGIYIVDLQKNVDLWKQYAFEQAEYMLSIGLVPDASDDAPEKAIRFGPFQHPKIKPMFDRSGDDAFRQARDAWKDIVEDIFRQLHTRTKTYISPFDGQIKRNHLLPEKSLLFVRLPDAKSEEFIMNILMNLADLSILKFLRTGFPVLMA